MSCWSEFEWNDMAPYPFNVLAPEQEDRRFLLLDARYSVHTAHTAAIYLRFSL